jgi:hypothetical protein
MAESNTAKKAAAKKATSSNANDSGTPANEGSAPASGSPESPVLDPTKAVPDASSAQARVQQGAGGDAEAAATAVAKHQQEGSVVSGPNHDLPDPTPEHTARTPAQMVNTDSEAGPLEPPTDALLQRDPVNGYSMSSTDPVYGNTGGQTVAGERHERLVDENDQPINADDLFTDDDPSKTFVSVDKRVFEEFYYPNTTVKAKRLLYTPGQRINRADASRMQASMSALDRNKASA